MTKGKSILNLVLGSIVEQQDVFDGWELTPEWQEAIEGFSSANTLDEEQKKVVAGVILDRLTTDKHRTVASIDDLLTVERMYGNQYDVSDLSFTDLDHELSDMDFDSKYDAFKIVTRARSQEEDIQGVIDELYNRLSNSENKQAAIDGLEGKLVSDVKAQEERGVEARVYKTLTSEEEPFLLSHVFMQPMESFVGQRFVRERSDSKSVALSDRYETESNVSSSTAHFRSSGTSHAVTGHSDVSDLDSRVAFMHSLYDDFERREEISRNAIKALDTLEKVSGENGKFLMAENSEDKVDIIKDPETEKYTIVPGDAFTGIIKMKRDVKEGGASFDVLEFQNGVLVSGIEGTSGESKISNMASLQREMVASHLEEPPLFIAHSQEAQEELLRAYFTPVFEATQSMHRLARQDSLVDETVVSADVWMDRRYQLRVLEQQVLADIKTLIKPEEKTGMHVPVFGSKFYHREHDALARDVTSVIMNQFAAQPNLPIETLKQNQGMILQAASRVVTDHKEDLESILKDKEVYGSPHKVEEKFRANEELVELMSREVQEEYDNALARDNLRKDMVQQMQDKFPPEASFYKTYTSFRDALVNHIVDKSMQNFPLELDAKTIEHNHDIILADFERSYSSHDKDIRKFLQSHKAAYITSPDLSTAKGTADLSVWEEVAKDTMSYEPVPAKDAKRTAVYDLMNDLGGVLAADVKPATWGMGLADYWVERNAAVREMILGLGRRIYNDPSVTPEMIYSNRDDIIHSVREEVIRNQEEFTKFLGNNKNKSADYVKEQWSKDGKDVTSAVGNVLVESLKSAPDTSEELLLEEEKRLRADLLEAAKNNIMSRQEEGMLGTTTYYVERDALAGLIVNQTMEDLKKKGVSGTDLKVNHDTIIHTFESSLRDHSEVIQERLEYIYQNQPLFSDHSVMPSTRREQIAEEAVDILQERRGEVVISDDVATKFGRAVLKISPNQEVPVTSTVVSPDVLRAGAALRDLGVSEASMESQRLPLGKKPRSEGKGSGRGYRD